uniref:Uncharacterized protein n=1 Tax=Anguilla anguilla TaxID=7936 RepID=A0A0E9TCX6_ANGAN
MHEVFWRLHTNYLNVR